MKKRLISIVFALLMLCQLLSFSILASDVVPDENETPDIGWENPVYYTVTLPEAPVGYTITVAEGSSTTVEEGGSFFFTVTVADGYKKGDNFAVLANDVDVTSTGVNDVYTIENITANQKITVTGVEEEATEPDGIAGDINGDGRVNSRDTKLLRQYIAKYEDLEYDEAALDLNGDGRVNSRDTKLLRQYIAKYEGLTIYYNGKIAVTT